MNTEFLKLCIICNRTRFENQFVYAKVQFILVPPSLSTSAPTPGLLWRRHWSLHQRPATSTWWCSPIPNGDGSKWQDRSPRGLDRKVTPESLPPLSPHTKKVAPIVFSLSRLLTGHNWVAPLLLIDRTPFRHLLILALLLISGNVHPNPGPISNHPHPRYPCSVCHLDVGRDFLQCSACLKWVHFLCSSLTCADFCTICATGTAVGWRCPACHPQRKTGSPT